MKRFVFLLFLLTITISSVAQKSNKISLANEYYNNGDYEKAEGLYSELAKNQRNIPFIHEQYFKLLLESSDFKKAQSYIKQVIKFSPGNIKYKIDQGILFKRKGKLDEATKIFEALINDVKSNNHYTRQAGQYFVAKNLNSYARDVYLSARKESSKSFIFALDLAQVYRRMNERENMVNEYLNFADENPANVNYIKRILQSLLTKEEDLQSLEKLLYAKVQRTPDKVFYSDLLIWVNLQQKNFYGAFIQARAFDKRFKTNGKPVIDIGYIAYENKDYKNARNIFEHIVDEYPTAENPYFITAQQYMIKSKEQSVKEIFPIDSKEIRGLIVDYQKLIEDTGLNGQTRQSKRDQALLYAFYLNELDSAINLLSQVVEDPRSEKALVAECKLDLGDIYLLRGEPWESTLLYSQVEKSDKESSLGYEAKLRNAKLSFYTGNFELAEGHLDVLKLATSREIANDAMSLSLLIKDNVALDTSEHAMRAYAHIELLLFQNQNEEALKSLDSMLVVFKGHSLTDEILWLKSRIYLEQGEFENCIVELDKITKDYSYDILSDDAAFLKATIYQDHLGKEVEAKDLYRNFMTKYPGSKYTSEARKRFRVLRGDFVN